MKWRKPACGATKAIESSVSSIMASAAWRKWRHGEAAWHQHEKMQRRQQQAAAWRQHQRKYGAIISRKRKRHQAAYQRRKAAAITMAT